ncbi:MAG: chemotaxis protein CheW [Cyanobacteria bacterium CRU_2_1]|nr:chemotaxis protein CheW [Cyanobacteria bacterium RU_5_0]NJR58909.1 chemotaxis protein CheW [Cyanobacteria bacterium CRU_2_1]
MDVETNSSSLQSLQDRYILTQIGQQQLAFPSQWVAEILLIERSQVLILPFYDSAILGVVHHRGQIVPLVAIQQIFEGMAGATREIISVVQLSQKADSLAGIGIVVDRALENRSHEQFTNAFSEHDHVAVSPQTEQTILLFRPEMLSDRLWEPQCSQLV